MPSALSPTAAANLQLWRTHPAYAEWREELAAFLDQAMDADVEDAFSAVLPFGTAGRRGPEGVGPNRFNRRTAAESAAGLAAIARRDLPPPHAVVIGFDGRRHSAAYADLCAEVFLAAGFAVALFDAPCATPQLAFEVHRRAASCGVMITASHNLPTDNGFKAYWCHGGQLVPPVDRDVMAAVMALAGAEIPRTPLTEAGGRLEHLSDDHGYLDYVAGQAVGTARAARLVYSPLHGVGARIVPPVLARAGFADVPVVAAQAMSPDFATLPDGIANPEMPSALALTLASCQAIEADAGLASDPDADRIGMLARETDGSYRFLSGNELGTLIGWHTITARARTGTLPADGVLLRSVVGAGLVDAIAAEHGLTLVNDLPIGFKWFGEILGGGLGDDRFLAALDESHGYNRGALVRDKDAASAALALAELVADVKAAGRTISDVLDDLAQRYGVHEEQVHGVRVEERARIDRWLEQWRADPPEDVAGFAVRGIEDRLAQPWVSSVSGLALPDNFLLIELEPAGQLDRLSLGVRPSGTEPKLKLYLRAVRRLQPGEPLVTVRSAVRQLVARVHEAVMAGFGTG